MLVYETLVQKMPIVHGLTIKGHKETKPQTGKIFQSDA